MDNNSNLFEWKGYSVGIVSLLLSVLMFFNYSSELFYSFFAAGLLSVLTWGTYIVIRMILLTARDKET